MIGLKKNRRGDIPITILVIGVFAVCTLAILSFIFSTINIRNSFVGIDIIEKVNKDVEVGVKTLPIHEEENKTNYLPWKKDELLFSVEYGRP